MTTTLDPGQTTPTKPPHQGDADAKTIRTAMKRVKAQAVTR